MNRECPGTKQWNGVKKIKSTTVRLYWTNPKTHLWEGHWGGGGCWGPAPAKVTTKEASTAAAPSVLACRAPFQDRLLQVKAEPEDLQPAEEVEHHTSGNNLATLESLEEVCPAGGLKWGLSLKGAWGKSNLSFKSVGSKSATAGCAASSAQEDDLPLQSRKRLSILSLFWLHFNMWKRSCQDWQMLLMILSSVKQCPAYTFAFWIQSITAVLRFL